MKKKVILSLFCGSLAWIMFSSSSGGYSTNTDGARSTASGCSCHGSTTSINPTVSLDSAGTAVTAYYPGVSYHVILKGTASSARPYYGFELSVVKATGAGTTSCVQAGTWGTLPTGVRTSTRVMVEQSQTLSASGGFYTMSIPWSAPVAGTGSVRIYGNINGVDGTGGTGGDGAQTATNNGLTITEVTGSAAQTASVAVAVTGGSNTVCPGSTVNFTATPTNGGSAPTYQWKLNGANVGTNSPNYSYSTPANSDIITCVMTSNLTGVTGSPATSSNITITVSTPTASISQAGNTLTAAAGSSYQWSLNGSAINGATSQTLNITQSGSYTVAVTNATGCTATSAGFPATYTNGISSISADLGVKLYPSPNQGSFVIETQHLIGAEAVVTDIYGKVYSQRSLTTDREVYSNTGMSAGIYFVSITHEGKTQTIKMLVSGN